MIFTSRCSLHCDAYLIYSCMRGEKQCSKLSLSEGNRQFDVFSSKMHYCFYSFSEPLRVSDTVVFKFESALHW